MNISERPVQHNYFKQPTNNTPRWPQLLVNKSIIWIKLFILNGESEQWWSEMLIKNICLKIVLVFSKSVGKAVTDFIQNVLFMFNFCKSVFQSQLIFKTHSSYYFFWCFLTGINQEEAGESSGVWCGLFEVCKTVCKRKSLAGSVIYE